MPHRQLLAAALAAFALAPAYAQDGAYTDSPTSAWFKGLSSPAVKNCCDQADCRRAKSDYRDGSWWALSNVTQEWLRIEPDQITTSVSIFADAVLCEAPLGITSVDGRVVAWVYCFAPPPIGF